MTVKNCTQLDNWIQSTTVHNWTTDDSQQLYTTEQLKTVINQTQLDTWIQSTTAHNWTTEYSQQLDNWLKSTTVHNWTTEYSQQLYPTGQLNAVNNHAQVVNWIQSTH